MCVCVSVCVLADAARATPGVGDEPMCFKLNGFTDMDRAKAIRRMSEVCACACVFVLVWVRVYVGVCECA